MSAPVLRIVERLRRADGSAIDVQLGAPAIGGRALDEIQRRGVGGSQRVVDGERGGVVVAVRIGRVENTAPRGCAALAGRFAVSCAVVVACGALSLVVTGQILQGRRC